MIPPFLGFFPKFFVFLSFSESYSSPLLILLILSSLLSSYSYISFLQALFLPHTSLCSSSVTPSGSLILPGYYFIAIVSVLLLTSLFLSDLFIPFFLLFTI